ncbi:MAG: TetR/AcrR family transcriptional regulator [bacterium]
MKNTNKTDDNNSKDKILIAAMDEFVEFGYYGARTQRIANKAKVNKALLHYYFSNKERMYEEALAKVVTLLIDKLNGISDEPVEIEKKMEQIMDVYISLFTDYSGYFRFVLSEVLRGGDKLKKIIIPRIKEIPFNPINGTLYKYFKEQMKQGNIKKVNVFHLIISIISQIAPIFLAKGVIEKIIGGAGFDKLIVSKFIKDRKKFIIDLTMNGIRKE